MKESEQYIVMDGCMYLDKCPTKMCWGGGGGGEQGKKRWAAPAPRQQKQHIQARQRSLFKHFLLRQHDQSMYQHYQVSMIKQCTNTAKSACSVNVPTLPSQHDQSMYQHCQVSMINQCTNTAKSTWSIKVPTVKFWNERGNKKATNQQIKQNVTCWICNRF